MIQQTTAQELMLCDAVIIEGLKVDSVIGVFDWEREITQPLVIDVTMYADQTQASATDDINHAIDYFTASQLITKICVERKAELIETLAELIAKQLLTDYAITATTVCVRKPTAVEQSDAVGVRITRFK